MGWGPFQFEIAPVQASEKSKEYDLLFGTITLLSFIFFVGVGLLVTYFAIRYRRGTKVDRRNPLTHHNGMEAAFMGIPLVLGLVMFSWSAVGFVRTRTMPKDGIEVFCIGKQWMWQFQHMNGVRENNELHVPVGTPVKITMISQDVIHSLYLPEMRAQYHAVPGRYTQLAFTPIKPGKYKILCAMHCGTQHSEMVGQLYVLNEREWAEWLEKGGNKYKSAPLTMAESGRQLYAELGCGNCHTGQNNKRAPSLVGIFGSTRRFTDGSSTVATRDYVRESIINPHERITQGYENTMTMYGGQISEAQVIALIEYIRTLTPETADFQRGDLQTASPGTNADRSSIDQANQNASAGAAQFRSSE